MNKNQLKTLVIIPELKSMGLYSKEAAELITMIISHESMQGEFLKQVRGPALGLSQMEPFTHESVVDYVRTRRPDLAGYMLREYGHFDRNKLVYNLRYMVAMTRLFFVRFPEPIPKTTHEQADYAKRRWNTEQGKATAEDYRAAYVDW